MSKNPPDWFARTVASIGVLLSLSGLGLSYYNYRWQTTTYREGQEERILVRLGEWRDMDAPANGKFVIEVVNIGLHPIYLKSIWGGIERRSLTAFYEPDVLSTKPSRKLEPGESTNYFFATSLFSDSYFAGLVAGLKKEGMEVVVETTKTRFDQKVRFDWLASEVVPHHAKKVGK